MAKPSSLDPIPPVPTLPRGCRAESTRSRCPFGVRRPCPHIGICLPKGFSCFNHRTSACLRRGVPALLLRPGPLHLVMCHPDIPSRTGPIETSLRGGGPIMEKLRMLRTAGLVRPATRRGRTRSPVMSLKPETRPTQARQSTRLHYVASCWPASRACDRRAQPELLNVPVGIPRRQSLPSHWPCGSVADQQAVEHSQCRPATLRE